MRIVRTSTGIKPLQTRVMTVKQACQYTMRNFQETIDTELKSQLSNRICYAI